MIVRVCDKLSLYIEAKTGVDDGGIETILVHFATHVVCALGFLGAVSIWAGVGSHVKAASVSLENVDVGALDVAFHLILSTAGSCLDEVKTCNAAEIYSSNISVEGDASTKKLRFVVKAILSTVLSLHEDGLV